MRFEESLPEFAGPPVCLRWVADCRDGPVLPPKNVESVSSGLSLTASQDSIAA